MKLSRNSLSFIRLLFIVAIAAATSCDTSNNVEPPNDQYFLKYYGDDGEQAAVDMVVNEDGSSILLGKFLNSQAHSILLIKVDADGNILWQYRFGTATDVAVDIEPASNGDYVILSNHLTSVGNTDIKIIRVNGSGIKTDSVVYGTPANDFAKSITPVTDGGFIVSGSTEFEPKGGAISSFLHFRCDANFVFDNSKWREIIGQEGLGIVCEVTKIIERANKFYVLGYSNTPIDDNIDSKKIIVYYEIPNGVIPINLGSLGDFKNDIETAFVMQAPDALQGGYFIVSTFNKNENGSRLRVSKLKDLSLSASINNIQFDLNVSSKRLEGVYASPSLITPIGYLVVANETKATGETDIVLCKVDQAGSEIWSVNFGAEKNDSAAAVAELPNGKILVLCTIESALQRKMALLKLNTKGQFLN